jgi:hypothetical protein
MASNAPRNWGERSENERKKRNDDEMLLQVDLLRRGRALKRRHYKRLQTHRRPRSGFLVLTVCKNLE